MDLQRSLLIGAIAILSFMLLTEWVAFSEERDATESAKISRLIDTEAAATVPADADLPIATPAQEVPQEPASLADIDDDLPSPPAQDTAAEEAPATAPANTALITVETDVLSLAIDLNGGDIIQLALNKHLEMQDDPDSPFVLLEQNEGLVYVAQSGLIGPDGVDTNGRAQYTAAKSKYTLNDGADKLVVDLAWQGNGAVTVTKRFTFRPGDYLVDVEFLVSNDSEQRWQGNLFGQIKRESGPPPSQETNAMGMQPFLGVATTTNDDRFKKFGFDDLADEPFKAQLPGGWIAMIQHYFLSAWIPNPDQSHNYSARVTRTGFNIAGFTSPALTLDPGKSGSVSAGFYAGPKDQERLEEISPYLDLSVDYGFLWWLAKPLFWLLTFIQGYVGNWGVAIILLTVVVKGVFFKLSEASYKSMANMRRVQPKMVEIREQYAEDKQKQSQAMMDLYRKEKINPMGGCLPILVQMPVFIALYWMLMESVELRHAPFALWIEDLSVMDPYFVLPLLMGASMFFMQKLNPPPPDPMQAKIMQWMPVMFTFFFLWFPAGLVLYWLANNLLSMAQQYVITRKIEKAGAPL
ncbi:MAG: membrane protein insertase YidC [Halioglobus sp.]|nr:membrane protein insertase YidC [Halioglobus sp.]